jgi:hypothetical protein
MTGAPAAVGKQASQSPLTRRLPGTRSIRAAKPLLARLLQRQSVGALTGRAAFPSHGLHSRNRLAAALPLVLRSSGYGLVVAQEGVVFRVVEDAFEARPSVARCRGFQCQIDL